MLPTVVGNLRGRLVPLAARSSTWPRLSRSLTILSPPYGGATWQQRTLQQQRAPPSASYPKWISTKTVIPAETKDPKDPKDPKDLTSKLLPAQSNGTPPLFSLWGGVPHPCGLAQNSIPYSFSLGGDPNESEDKTAAELVLDARLREHLVPPESLEYDLETFPHFVHPLTKTELYTLSRASITNSNSKLRVLHCLEEHTEAYMQNLARATAKSLEAHFVSLRSEVLFDFLNQSSESPRLKKRASSFRDKESRALVLATALAQLGFRVVVYIEDLGKIHYSTAELALFAYLRDALGEQSVVILGGKIITSKQSREESMFGPALPATLFTQVNVLPPSDPVALKAWTHDVAAMKKRV